MMEWLLILTLWNGETQYQTYGPSKDNCNTVVRYLITRESPLLYGPPHYMNIYCEELYPGEPIVEWWKICSWRDGCWGPDTVTWSDIPPTRPGWYLHRYRTKDERGGYSLAHPFKVDYLNGILSIVGTGATWRKTLPDFPVASVGGEWTQDALVMRDIRKQP